MYHKCCSRAQRCNRKSFMYVHVYDVNNGSACARKYDIAIDESTHVYLVVLLNVDMLWPLAFTVDVSINFVS